VENPAEEIVCSPDQCLRVQNSAFLRSENKSGTNWPKRGVSLLAREVEANSVVAAMRDTCSSASGNPTALQLTRITRAVVLSRPSLAKDSSTSNSARLGAIRGDSGGLRNSSRMPSCKPSTRPSVQSRKISPGS